ncbi:MAG: DUF502 domain-containing protein, partial [Proteobacteria bacterium]|nr:DUF502 domain-containing protein [Pseudomonadota bacterium]
MLPIAVLPVAGLLLRLGQPDLLNIAFISAAGQAVFANLGLLFAVGVLVGNFLGRQLLLLLDELMAHIPVVKGIYGATKQLMGALQSGQGGSFQEVVLVEWPHEGSRTLGFVARRDCSWAVPGGEDLVSVYIPTAPNPTSGYVVMLPASRLQAVD